MPHTKSTAPKLTRSRNLSRTYLSRALPRYPHTPPYSLYPIAPDLSFPVSGSGAVRPPPSTSPDLLLPTPAARWISPTMFRFADMNVCNNTQPSDQNGSSAPPSDQNGSSTPPSDHNREHNSVILEGPHRGGHGALRSELPRGHAQRGER
eukprot:56784-Pyramimonas_sp.AAC.1